MTWLITAICATVLYFYSYASEGRKNKNFLFGRKPQRRRKKAPHPTQTGSTAAAWTDNTFTCTCAINALGVWQAFAECRQIHPQNAIYWGKCESYWAPKHFPQNAQSWGQTFTHTHTHTLDEISSELRESWYLCITYRPKKDLKKLQHRCHCLLYNI